MVSTSGENMKVSVVFAVMTFPRVRQTPAGQALSSGLVRRAGKIGQSAPLDHKSFRVFHEVAKSGNGLAPAGLPRKRNCAPPDPLGRRAIDGRVVEVGQFINQRG
jgi:hypothetical protein